MDKEISKTNRKRGQRRNNIEIPKRFLDRLTPSVLETLQFDEEVESKTQPDFLTLEKLFNQYYSAGEVAGAAERTLQDYIKHMRWLRRFMASEYGGLDNFIPNREVIRTWISHMLTVQKLKPSTINIWLRTVKAMFNWAISEGLVRE